MFGFGCKVLCYRINFGELVKNIKIVKYTTVIKLKGELCYKMKNLYLFIQINFIPFKVIPF